MIPAGRTISEEMSSEEGPAERPNLKGPNAGGNARLLRHEAGDPAALACKNQVGRLNIKGVAQSHG